MIYKEDCTLSKEYLEELTEQGMEGLPDLVRIIVNEAMQIERENYLCAKPYERSEGRQGYANGYKPKTVKTRVGEVTFDIPQVREGGFYPEALGKGLRSERALQMALAEMYVQGVSARKVAAITERLCGTQVSASQVNLNLLLLRQFISVLPMIISLIFLVYLVDGFRHFWASIAMAAVLAFIPGVVHYNVRFWHPDSIIVLLVLLSIWLLKRDNLRFGRNFYLAAFTIGLNVVIKIWGFFFFLAIGGYLLAGLISKKLEFWKMAKAGIFFILVMIASIIITSPSILIPWNLKTYIAELQEYYPVMRQGYDEPDPQGVYRTGLAAWMVYFRMHFMQDFFFYFSVLTVVAGSLLGTQKTLNRLILAWCAVVGTYLVGWVAVKSFQYMLPLMIPLYGAVFLLPQIAGGVHYPRPFQFLANPKAKGVLTAIVVVLTAVQVYFNLKLFPL